MTRTLAAVAIAAAFAIAPAAAVADPLALEATTTSCNQLDTYYVTPPAPLGAAGAYLYSVTSDGTFSASVASKWASGQQMEYMGPGDKIWGDTDDGQLYIDCDPVSTTPGAPDGSAVVRWYDVPTLLPGSPVSFSGVLSPGTTCAGDEIGCGPGSTGLPAGDSAFEFVNNDFNDEQACPSGLTPIECAEEGYAVQPLYEEDVTVTSGTLADGGTGDAGPVLAQGAYSTTLAPVVDYSVTGENSSVPVNYTITWSEVGCPTDFMFQATGSTWPVNACVLVPPPSSSPPTPPTSSPSPSTSPPPRPPVKYNVPVLRGLTLAKARRLLKLHFRVGKIRRVSGSGVPIGRILRASPRGGSRQVAGTAINIWIRR